VNPRLRPLRERLDGTWRLKAPPDPAGNSGRPVRHQSSAERRRRPCWRETCLHGLRLQTGDRQASRSILMFHSDPRDPTGRNSARPDRRREQRRRVLLTGEIVNVRNSCTADCTIRDRSEAGVRIRLKPDGLSPDPILIEVRAGMAHEARIVWRTDHEAGLAFTSSVDIRQSAPPHLRAARRIWVELALR
jgi:hypothetical protein